MKFCRFLSSYIAVTTVILLGASLVPTRAIAQRPLGIDVSSFQGSSINWVSVKSAGITFAWAKATQGTYYVDADFPINEANAKAAGVLIGAYHFADYNADPGTNGAIAEANYFWAQAKNYVAGGGSYLMPMLDVEFSFTNNTGASVALWVNQWCTTVSNLAAASGVTVTPVIYTDGSIGGSLSSTVTQWPLWMASPNGANTQTGDPNTTSPWGAWTIWQYGQATISGITTGVVDEDVFDGSAAELTNSLVIGKAIASAGSGATIYWDPGATIASPGSGGAGTWEISTTNWWLSGTGDVRESTAGDYAVFAGTAGTVTLGADVGADGLTFNTAGYIITGSHTLTLSGTTPVISVPSGSATYIDCVLGGSGYKLTGGGVLVLENAGNYSGSSTSAEYVNGPNTTLVVLTDHDTGNDSVTLNLENGGIYQDNDTTSGDQFLLPGCAIGLLTGGGIFDNPNASLTMSNHITGTGSLTFTGYTNSSGTPYILTLTDTGNNYSGGTIVQGPGELKANAAGTLGSTSGALTVSGGILDLGGASHAAGTVTISGGKIQNGTLTGSSYAGQSGTVSAVLAGSGAMTKTTSGTLTLSGANTYTGITTISSGLLQFSADDNLGAAPGSPVATKLTLNNGGISSGLRSTGSFTLNPNRGITLVGPNGGSIQVSSGQTVMYAGIITGGGNFGSGGGYTAGYGTNVLSGANNYTGTTTVASGTLRLGANGTLPSGTPLTIAADGNTGSTLDLGGFSQTIGPLASSTGIGGTGTATPNIKLSGALTVLETNNTAFSGIISGSGGSLTINGTGTLTLNDTNTYTGPTTISAGTLALGGTGLINGTTTITIAAGATFDVSAIAAYTLSGSTTLSASGASAPATINGGTTVSLGSQPIILAYDGSHPALSISQAALSLNGNVFTVNGSALAPGTYTLIQQAIGNISSSGSFSVSGTVIGAGRTGSISVSGGNVNLIVNVKATPSFSSLTASQFTTYGTTSISLGGKVSAGSAYPANGETVTVTINGNAQNTSINDATGDFSFSYNPHTIPASGTPYTITYSYAGDSLLNSATDTSTALTVNKTALSITANGCSKIYGQTKTYGAGSTAFTSTPLQNGETIGSVTLACSGGAPNSPVAGSPYTITPSAVTGGTITAANYNITYIAGTLTVSPLTVNLTGTRTTDGATEAAAEILSVANKVGGDSVTVALGNGTLAGAGFGSQAITSFGTLALGNAGGQGNANGTGSAAQFNLPSGAAVDSTDNLYVADTANNAIREVTPAGVVTTLSFTGLNNPSGVAVDAAGDVFVADTGNNRIVELPFGGSQTTLAITGLKYPAGVAVDTAGDVFVADTGNSRIVELPFGGSRTTVTITGLDEPSSVAVDVAGDIFVADTGNNQIVELPFGGSQTTLAFTGLGHPYGVAVDASGDVFVTDKGNNRVVELSGGTQTTLALTGLNVNGPYGVAVDAAGDVFVTDSANNQIKELPSGGSQTTLAGSAVAANYTLTGASGSVSITETPSFSNLTASQAITYGAASITLTGTVSGAGPVYPTNGETITVTINGNAQTTTVNDSTGDFSINYNTSTTSAGSTVTITYSYAGDGLLTAASDGSTTLEVNQLPVVLTGTRPYDGTTTAAFGILTVANPVGSDIVTVASGSATLVSANGGVEAIAAMGTLQLGGPAGGNYTITGGVGSVTITMVSPAFSNLTVSQPSTYGTTNVTLSGTVSAAGPLYPASGETITVTINGIAQTTTISDTTGDFSIYYNPSAIPASGSAYTIAYSYAGDASFNSASNGGTTLTINQRPVTLTGTRAYDGTTTATNTILSVTNKVGSDVVNLASGSATLASASVGVEAISSVGTLALGGAAAGNYTLNGAGGSVTITVPPFSITSEYVDSTGTNFVITWQSAPGATYHVVGNTNAGAALNTWTNVGGPITATSTNTSFTNPITSPMGVFDVISP